MSTPTYEAVIGLEVHCQLQTEAKVFSSDSAAFGAGPNQHVDPVSLGHPGTLPVLNEQVVDYAIRLGLAVEGQVAPRSVLARKHYFYPDLPKGYQISQFETPIISGGHIDIVLGGQGGAAPQPKRIHLTRIHIEEDAGKSVHDQDPFATLLDYNRCGVPLLEIVSEPELRSPREAYLYVQKIRQIVRYLGICDGNMEEGSLRCDANVSIRPVGETKLGTKTEIKNMNSITGVERALTHEIKRQIALVKDGGTVVQETRLWDANKEETRSMRGKEEAHDYRYFPDPDLVPIVVDNALLAKIHAELPELPEARHARYTSALGLPTYDAGILTEERGVADYFEATLASLQSTEAPSAEEAKAVSNFVMTDVLRVLNEEGIAIDTFTIAPDRLAALIRLRLDDAISSSGATEIFEALLTDTERSPQAIAEANNLLQVSDSGALVPIVQQVLDANPKQVAQYLGGKPSLIGFFIGQVMRTFDGSPDPKLVRTLLAEHLEARR